MRFGPIEIPESFAFSYRNARGLGAAAALLLAIVMMSALRCNPVVDHGKVLGLVLEIEAEGLTPFGDGQVMSRVLMAVAEPDTGKVRILLPPPVPHTGDFVPLKYELHRKGDIEYRLDHERWLIEGPQQAKRP